MREKFARRTGTFGPEDPWFETRSRAFWDDAVTTQGLAVLAISHLSEEGARTALRFPRAHRGLFVIAEVDQHSAHLVDLWSGAELLVHPIDEPQRITFQHMEGPMDARVVAGSSDGVLFVLPGALHHGPDALRPLERVLEAARERSLETHEVLDAILRMELVFRTSSRVKAAFAYRAESLSRAHPR